MVPKISDAEWRVMQLLWQKAPQSAQEIIKQLSTLVDWKPKTIKTLLTRLVQKKAVEYHVDGRLYQYFPIVNQEMCRRSERKSFLRRVYGGSLKPLLTAFIEEEKLSAQEITDLKKILAKKENKK
jgi:BlaI family penicillinase repressor